MIRINSILNLALATVAAAALVLSGCAAPAGTGDDELGNAEDSLLGAHLIRLDDGQGDSSGRGDTIGSVPAATATHPANVQGPHPDPWMGANPNPSGGPHPDPWNPRSDDFAPPPGAPGSGDLD